jgi:alkaline phosphatase
MIVISRKFQFLVIFSLLSLFNAVSSQRSLGTSHDAILKSHTKPFSIILMIGDGMGFQHVELGRWIEKGVDGSLNMETLPYLLNVTTRSANSATTDSAAAATAMATGNKTDNGMLSYFPNDQTLETILEISIDRNMSTGLVTTTEIFHATPAAFYSHVDSRTNTSEIVNQLSQQSKIEVIFGGGSNAFSAAILTEMEQNGYTYITNRSQLTSISEGKVLGLFSTLSIPYEQVRDPELTPSLSEMTNKALEVVSQDNDGFFLLIEGGKIDWGAHANNKNNTALEVIEFDKAVGNVKNFVETQTDHDILFLVTADHETGGLSVKSNTLNSSLPSDTKTHTQNKALRLARTENISLSWQRFSEL